MGIINSLRQKAEKSLLQLAESSLLQWKAKQGDVDAQIELADMYYHGKGVSLDHRQAAT